MSQNEPRRAWLRNSAMLIGGAVLVTTPPLLEADHKPKESASAKSDPGEDVSPAEDLMREHGVLKRVLLIYREVIARIDAKRDFPPGVVSSSAKLVRSFIEDYHEKLEEDYLFPRLRKANKLVDLVDVLNQQHQRGRVVTDRTIQLANSAAMKDVGQRAALRDSLYRFVRMYEPHEAREDTVLFPSSARSCRSTNTTPSERSSRRKRTSYFTAMASRRTWTPSRTWKTNWAFTICASSPRPCDVSFRLL
jgi:hemerythrin-like domain-containing protein